MKIEIRKQQISAIFVQIILLISENIIFSTFKYNNLMQWCQVASVFIVINLITQLIGLKLNGRLLSVGCIFIIFSYLIHLSYCICYALDAFADDSSFYTYFILKFGSRNLSEAFQYAITTIGMIYLLYILCIKDSTSVYEINKQIESDEDNNIIRICGNLYSFIFGIIFFISQLVIIIYVFTTGDYSEQSTVTSTSFISMALNLQSFYFQGLLFKAIYYKSKNDKLKVKNVLYIAIISILFTFLTGSRSRGIMILLIFLVFWIIFIEPLNWKRAIIYIIAGCFLMQVLIAVRYARSTRELTLGLIITNIFSFDNNIVYETLDEFGRSIFVTVGFMNNEYQGNAIDFFLKELLSVFPRISSWGGEIFLAPTIRTGFESMYSLGSTYIADIYYYFGNVGKYIAAFFGIIFAFIDNCIRKDEKEGKYLSAIILFPGIVSIFNGVRAQATFGLKMFLYSWLMFLIIKTIFTHKSR